MLRKKRLLLALACLVLLVVAGTLLFIRTRHGEDPSSKSGDSENNSLQTAQEAIEGGVNQGNSLQALYVASTYINDGKREEARQLAFSVEDTLLNDDQLINKYTILLDSYKQVDYKQEFINTMETYKQALLARNNDNLKAEAETLNQAYVDAVFSAPPDIPPDQEVP